MNKKYIFQESKVSITDLSVNKHTRQLSKLGEFSVKIDESGMVETTEYNNYLKKFDNANDAYCYHYRAYHESDSKRCHSHWNICNQLSTSGHASDTDIKL